MTVLQVVLVCAAYLAFAVLVVTVLGYPIVVDESATEMRLEPA